MKPGITHLPASIISNLKRPSLGLLRDRFLIFPSSPIEKLPKQLSPFIVFTPIPIIHNYALMVEKPPVKSPVNGSTNPGPAAATLKGLNAAPGDRSTPVVFK